MSDKPSHFSSFFQEPLLHFMLLAGMLFVADALFSGSDKELVLVDQQTARYIIKQREALELRSLSPLEQQQIIQGYIENEILYREAYKKGLDKSDTRMRRNLILKMRGLLTDEIESPTDEQLRDFYIANRQEYMIPERWSLEQVFFTNPQDIPDTLKELLNQGKDPSGYGDIRLGLGRALPNRSKSDLVVTFGPEGAKLILGIEDDYWHGPIESPRGIHFIRISGRQEARPMEYEEVKSYLEQDWTLKRSQTIVKEEIARLRDSYEVVIEPLETKEQ